MKIKSLFIALSAAAVISTAAVSCQEEQVNDSLSVEPTQSLNFKAAGNESVSLKVTTTAKSWNYKTPDWVIAGAKDDVLTVNVKDNKSKEPNVGRIEISAGNAKTVTINVFQEAFSEEGGDGPGEGGEGDGGEGDGGEGSGEGEGDGGEGEGGDGPGEELVTPSEVSLNNKSDNASTYITFNNATQATLKLSASIAAPSTQDVVVELILDEGYLAEYNYVNRRQAELFPASALGLPSSMQMTIAAGATESETLEISLNLGSIPYGPYEKLIPFYLKAVTNATVDNEASRLSFSIFNTKSRAGVKNIAYLEVNGTNPLNVLEYKLQDGTYFFDAVIVFAANINYDDMDDVVYLHNNPNVQALLDETEVYLQPLRKAGIKVYLGLLGNHDEAGLAQLSHWGAEQWAKEVALTCKTYKLDGVNLDDEYSSSPIIGNRWFDRRSTENGAYLMYRLKQELHAQCPWPTEVSAFEWGSIKNVGPLTTEDGVVHKQSEFIDFMLANYGSYVNPANYGDLTLDQCSGASIELNHDHKENKQSMTSSIAQQVKNGGYGWCMWFAFNPAGTPDWNNRENSMIQFETAAQAFYGQGMQQPKNYYNKISEGVFDPKAYPIN